MPFTLSHPAAILPFYKWTRRKDLFLPLAIGSMMPDFGYYFTFSNLFRENAHTPLKIFTFCLPIGLMALAIILFLQKGIVFILPDKKSRMFFNDHLPKKLDIQFFVLASNAIILGALTHICWDGFTHKNGYMVTRFQFLNFSVFFGLEVFRILQHFSTLLGAFFLYRFYKRFPVKAGNFNKQSLLFLAVANIFSLTIAFTTPSSQLFFFITTYIRSFLLITLFTAFVIIIRRRNI